MKKTRNVRMGKHLLILSMAILLAGIAACQVKVKGEVEEARSSLQRNEHPDASQAEIITLNNGNTDFSLALFRALNRDKPSENSIFSSFSISQALSMAFAGACNDTENEMAEALRFYLPGDRHHVAFNALDLKLRERCKDPLNQEKTVVELNLVNALWAQKGYSLLETYLDLLALNYDAGLRLLDFILDPEPARLTINDWVAEQTKDKILDLIQPGGIDTTTRLVLTNAVYFKAAWADQFKIEKTEKGLFHNYNGSTSQASIMNQLLDIPYSRIDDIQALEIPYEGLTYSFLVILPDPGCFDAVASRLDRSLLESIRTELSPYDVTLGFPKFEITDPRTLKEILAQFGMISAFDPTQADFSGINGGRDLFIGNVIHKAFINVDEMGTEAAAATATTFSGIALLPSVTVRVDRPFIYLIQERETGAILFMGSVKKL